MAGRGSNALLVAALEGAAFCLGADREDDRQRAVGAQHGNLPLHHRGRLRGAWQAGRATPWRTARACRHTHTHAHTRRARVHRVERVAVRDLAPGRQRGQGCRRGRSLSGLCLELNGCVLRGFSGRAPDDRACISGARVPSPPIVRARASTWIAPCGVRAAQGRAAHQRARPREGARRSAHEGVQEVRAELDGVLRSEVVGGRDMRSEGGTGGERDARAVAGRTVRECHAKVQSGRDRGSEEIAPRAWPPSRHTRSIARTVYRVRPEGL